MESGPSVRVLGMHVRLLREQVCNDWQMSVEGRLVQRGLAYDASTEYSRYRNSSSTRPYLALLVLDIRNGTALLDDFTTAERPLRHMDVALERRNTYATSRYPANPC